MARTKAPAIRREPSEIHAQSNGVVHRNGYSPKDVPALLDEKLASNGAAGGHHKSAAKKQAFNPAVLVGLLFSVGGIYASLYVGARISQGLMES
jgi:hypothetical protein